MVTDLEKCIMSDERIELPKPRVALAIQCAFLVESPL
jgi:hypothetical protein